MGQTCTSCCDKNQEQGLDMTSGNQSLKIATNNIDNSDNNAHAPKADDIILINKTDINKVNDRVSDALVKFGPFKVNYPRRDSWKELPELGPYRYPNKSTYVGQYKNGWRHGEGIMIGDDGSKYEGLWANDHRNGVGRFIHADGDCYDGEWVEDKMQV